VRIVLNKYPSVKVPLNGIFINEFIVDKRIPLSKTAEETAPPPFGGVGRFA
jgi:hypothetical protein